MREENPSAMRESPTTSTSGTPAGTLALRLSPEERQAFMRKYKAKLCQAYGKVQIEYVEVPDSLLASTQELKPFFDASYRYATFLKPKPTTRKK